MPRISVVIPLFDKESTVVRAIGSVLAQTVAPAEIIVVDDGSTDGGPGRVEDHAGHVTLITQANAGPGSARNAGVRAAQGDWVAFLDADDYWLPWHLEYLTELIGARRGVGMVSSALLASPRRAPRRGRGGTIDYFRRAATHITVVHSSTVAIGRSALERTGGFSSVPNGEDLELWARVALAFPVAATTWPSAAYTIGPGVTDTYRRANRDEDPPLPTELSEVSPSVAVVVEALESGDHLPSARSLRRYIDSRVAWAMRHRLAAGDHAGARSLRSLMTSTAWPENAAPVAASAIPGGVLQRLLDLKRSLRSG